MHSRDQVPGSWTALVNDRAHPTAGTYGPYLDALARRATEVRADDLPFTAACALELEGCGKIDWVHRGVSGLKRLLRQ